jgi:murein DD-endopeptidase MepM/ murein hydrolase activator NlpD
MNNVNCFSINSTVIFGLGVSVVLSNFIYFPERAEATVSNNLPEPIILQNANFQDNQNNQLKNPVFISVSGPSTEPIRNLPKETKIALKLEPIINTQDRSNFDSPLVLAPVEKLVYQVKSGDTIDRIALKYDSSRQEIIQENHLNNPNLIKVNQNLAIPNEQLNQKNQDDDVLSSDLSADEVHKQIQQQSSLYIKQLKADVNKLREEYEISSEIVSRENGNQLRSQALEIAQEYENSWKPDQNKNRLVKDSDFSSNVLKTELGQEQTSQENSREEGLAVKETSHSSGDMVATTPTPINRYNPFLHTSVGDTVSPNLPPLSSPEQYLPDTPKFNGYIWPAKGVFTSGYGPRWGRMHRGVDIAAPVGTPIMASAQGEVISAGWNSGGFGNLVKVKHPDGSLTLYAHNKRLLVRRGQIVEQGQRIAEMGNTGRSTGAHLHFEIHTNGKGAVNPIAFLPKERP